MNISLLLNLNVADVLNYKVFFAQQTVNAADPLNAFLRDQFQEWMLEQITGKLDRDYIISFINYRENEWLFVGFYEVFQTAMNQMEIKLLGQSKDLIGKLIVKYERIQRKTIINFENCMEFMVLNETLREKFFVKEFSGFKTSKVKYDLLKTIVKNECYSWKNALSKAKGIYLVTDTKTGRLFVGAAYGDVTFWDRWLDYAHNGHGGNRFFKKKMELNGKDYSYNLQFSFLEVCDLFMTNQYIIERENFWKEILLTREFGYNIV